MSLGIGTHILEVNNYNMQATTIPKIDVSNTDVIGKNTSTDSISKHWIVETGAPFWIKWMILFSAGAAVLMVMIGGVMFMMAGANDEMLSRAKKTVTFAFLGLLLAMFSYFIVKVIDNIEFVNS